MWCNIEIKMLVIFNYFYLGVGDNVVSCLVMLEIIRIIFKLLVKFKYNVIFLFNGVEENML